MPDLKCEWCGSTKSVRAVMDGRIPAVLCEDCIEDMELGTNASDECDCEDCRHKRSKNFT